MNMIHNYSKICAIEYFIPEKNISNKYLCSIYPEWSEEKIFRKTGIRNRHIANIYETALDLAIHAANKLFDKNPFKKSDIDAIFFCTTSPDYRIPYNAALAAKKLNLPVTIASFDISHGCSGYIYLLSLAKAYIESGQATCILCLAADTLSKDIAINDKSTRTIFGDAASATLISLSEQNDIDSFVFMTDGDGYKNLIIPESGSAKINNLFLSKKEFNSNGREPRNFYMNGPAVFQFTLRQIPKLIFQCLKRANKSILDIDFFILHQSNLFMLNYIRQLCKIPEEKFIIEMENIGNTVQSSIPIALKIAQEKNIISSGNTVMLVGYGIGYSCAACIITI